MKPPEIIQTKRLTLKKISTGDAEAIFESYAQDSEVVKFLIWRPHHTLNETRAYVQSRIDAWKAGSEFTWMIYLKDQTLIGCVGLEIEEFKAEVGYVFARAHWNQGYAAEALGAIVSWSLEQPFIFRVWAGCDVENRASARVLEKAGMKREGILRKWIIHPNVSNQPRDCFCYAIVKE